MGGLRDGYGVLLGTLEDYKPDDPNDFGQFMHGVLTVGADGTRYRCAVDVDTHAGAIQVHWRVHPLRIGEWAPLLALGDGWHDLAPEPQSGAVDYIRDPRLADLFFIPEYRERMPFWELPEPPLLQLPHLRTIEQKLVRNRAGLRDEMLSRAPVGRLRQETAPLAFQAMAGKALFFRPPWNAGSSAQALQDLEAVIAGAVRIAVFGEPFRVGKGVHNIHQNQGDPPGSSFAQENEIWQDGITIAIRADGTASAFMNKFSTQADQTNDDGAPLP